MKEIIWIDFYVYIDPIKLKIGATHEALNLQEVNSDKIANTEIDLDVDFDLDQHLEYLYSEITEKICNSDIFNMIFE